MRLADTEVRLMPVQESKLIFFDTETTGLRPGHDEVVEIASIMTDLKLREISRFEKKIKFDTEKITPEAAKVNGYNKEEWADAVPFQEWKDWLKKLVPYGHVAIGVGQNPRFDRDMIDLFYYKPAFFSMSYHVIDIAAFSLAMKVAGVVQVPNVRLETMMDAFKLGKQTHRAMGDCEAVLTIFSAIVNLFKGKDILSYFLNGGRGSKKEEPAEDPVELVKEDGSFL